MINLPNTIDKKPIFEKEDGTVIIDLTKQSLNLVVDQPMTNYYLVSDETAMRVDIISQVALGSVDNVEKMLKFNDISNPFTIDIGDLLFVPDLLYARMNLNSEGANDQQKLDIRNQYIQPEKESKLDPTLGKFDKRNKPKKADASKTAPPLPPNFANIGDQEIEIRGGKIFFGPNVSKNGNECEEPLSKSEFLAKLIKNRINR
jgi:hypothetical protein